MVVDLYKGATKLLLHTTKTTSRRVTVYLFAEVSKNHAVICIECFSSSAADSWLTETREQQDKREEVSPRLHTTHLTAASALSLTLTVSLAPTPTSILFFWGGGVYSIFNKIFQLKLFFLSVLDQDQAHLLSSWYLEHLRCVGKKSEHMENKSDMIYYRVPCAPA